MRAIVLLVLLVGCDKPVGTVDGPCKPDGTCTGDNLYCHARGYYDNALCVPKPLPPQFFETKPKCIYESDCFCTACAEKCGVAGLKSCAFSDTSVWGAKPSVCECR